MSRNAEKKPFHHRVKYTTQQFIPPPPKIIQQLYKKFTTILFIVKRFILEVCLGYKLTMKEKFGDVPRGHAFTRFEDY